MSPYPRDALYKRANAPIESRIHDLLQRMTVEEKARQLDMYAGVPDLIDKSIDATHVAKDGKFRTDQAEKLIGSLGAGSIHDLYGSAALNNEIQTWVMQHSRLGIPVLFAEEGLARLQHRNHFPRANQSRRNMEYAVGAADFRSHRGRGTRNRSRNALLSRARSCP